MEEVRTPSHVEEGLLLRAPTAAASEWSTATTALLEHTLDSPPPQYSRTKDKSTRRLSTKDEGVTNVVEIQEGYE
jgi:hypothetical protein